MRSKITPRSGSGSGVLADENLEVIQVFITKGPGLERSGGFGKMKDEIVGKEVELPCLSRCFPLILFLPPLFA